VSAIDAFILKLKRGETPFYRVMKSVVKAFIRPHAPRIPQWLKPPLRLLYEAHFFIIGMARLLLTVFYRHPLFQARCASIGRNVALDGLPFVSGHVEIHVGNDTWFGGKISIFAGRIFDKPKLIIKDRAELGWNVQLSVSREVVIEEDARVSYDCRVSDSDGHPREADLRAQNRPVDPRDIRPVRICRYAWIGNGSHIMKGVTIGEGAIVGANSVVISDVPPYCLAMGNPAEVYFRNFGRPAKKPDARAH
jgi:acetyltransferase-like isoleucine patch superfamily enzyme